MTEFRGFIPESKSFMGYRSINVVQRLWFWCRVPLAYLRYRYAMIKDGG